MPSSNTPRTYAYTRVGGWTTVRAGAFDPDAPIPFDEPQFMQVPPARNQVGTPVAFTVLLNQMLRLMEFYQRQEWITPEMARDLDRVLGALEHLEHTVAHS